MDHCQCMLSAVTHVRQRGSSPLSLTLWWRSHNTGYSDRKEPVPTRLLVEVQKGPMLDLPMVLMEVCWSSPVLADWVDSLKRSQGTSCRTSQLASWSFRPQDVPIFNLAKQVCHCLQCARINSTRWNWIEWCLLPPDNLLQQVNCSSSETSMQGWEGNSNCGKES